MPPPAARNPEPDTPQAEGGSVANQPRSGALEVTNDNASGGKGQTFDIKKTATGAQLHQTPYSKVPQSAYGQGGDSLRGDKYRTTIETRAPENDNSRPRDAAIREAQRYTQVNPSKAEYINSSHPSTDQLFDEERFKGMEPSVGEVAEKGTGSSSGAASQTRNPEVVYGKKSSTNKNSGSRRQREDDPSDSLQRFEKQKQFNELQENRSIKRSKAEREMLSSAGDILGDENGEQELPANRAENPDFPILIVMLAIIDDIIDFLELTIIGMLLTKALALVIAIVLFFWVLGKASGGWWKKRLIGWLWKRYIVATLIEFTPLGGIIPANTIFVLMAHYREKKLVKAANLVLEELHKAGIISRLK
jgi:hypothetical protein